MAGVVALSAKEFELAYSVESLHETEEAELYVSELSRAISKGKTLEVAGLRTLGDKAFPMFAWYPRH